MILGRLFKQYGKRRLAFGSRWMKAHGVLLIGQPSVFGLAREDVGPGVYDSYYYIPSDRVPVCNSEDAKRRWQNGQLQATQLREASQPRISLATSVVTFAMAMALVALAALTSSGERTLAMPSLPTTTPATSLDRAACEQTVARAMAGLIDPKAADVQACTHFLNSGATP